MTENQITIEINVPAKMRDGVTLYSDIYRPDISKPCPILLMRTPYSKSTATMLSFYFDVIRAAKNGYAVVVQDCRGSGSSEGEFYPFIYDFNDGYDAVEWAATQPWSNGKVGMLGVSYPGTTQWCAAVMQPPHLVTIFPGEIYDNLHTSLLYRGGAFQYEFSLLYATVSIAMLQLARQSLPPGELQKKVLRVFEAINTWNTQLDFLPLKDYPIIKELGVSGFYYDWLEHRDDAAYWEKMDWAKYEKVTIPVYNMTGWYDLCLLALNNYTGMKNRGSTDFARKNQKIIVGPWIHGGLLTNDIGQIDTGFGSSGGVIDITGIQLRWFDFWLKGIQNGIMNEPPVRIFVMGENTWRFENEWPLERTKYTKYYLHSDGKANTLNGSGKLNTLSPLEEERDVYIYDPRNPVPTKGGNIIGKIVSPTIMGSFDQTEIEKRSDVLVYTTAPLEKDIEVTGPVEVKLFAASTARDTDFTAKLVDVWPDGKAFNISDGIIRARYRDRKNPMKPELIEPNKVYEYTIDLWSTSNVFKKEHRIRVEISSSNFPHYDRNQNTGNAFGEDAEMLVAMQTIFHDTDRPSYIILPVIPR